MIYHAVAYDGSCDLVSSVVSAGILGSQAGYRCGCHCETLILWLTKGGETSWQLGVHTLLLGNPPQVTRSVRIDALERLRNPEIPCLKPTSVLSPSHSVDFGRKIHSWPPKNAPDSEFFSTDFFDGFFDGFFFLLFPGFGQFSAPDFDG